MKTVYLIRHAKSSWKDSSLRDFDRPLNKRGKRDAPFMANLLKEQGVQPDAIIASPAKRAFTTACHFAKALDISKTDILKEAAIYEAYDAEIMAIIHRQPDSRNTILLFGHNPTFTTVANQFAQSYIDNVPTCGIVKIEAAIDSWEAFTAKTAKVVSFQYPKEHFLG